MESCLQRLLFGLAVLAAGCTTTGSTATDTSATDSVTIDKARLEGAGNALAWDDGVAFLSGATCVLVKAYPESVGDAFRSSTPALPADRVRIYLWFELEDGGDAFSFVASEVSLVFADGTRRRPGRASLSEQQWATKRGPSLRWLRINDSRTLVSTYSTGPIVGDRLTEVFFLSTTNLVELEFAKPAPDARPSLLSIAGLRRFGEVQQLPPVQFDRVSEVRSHGDGGRRFVVGTYRMGTAMAPCERLRASVAR